MIKHTSEKFWSEFPDIYKNPSKVNNYLIYNSDLIEDDIKNRFKKLGLDKNFSIFANGGFGRKEIYPSSDIDLSIIQHRSLKLDYANLESFITELWDKGLKIGHSVRTFKDLKKAALDDPREYTSYLTRRPIISSQEINKKMNKVLNKLYSKKKFFNIKSGEQINRHKSFHSTEFNLEPDIKESPGGLRDFQSALWILQHCFNLNNYSSILASNEFKNIFALCIDSYQFIKAIRYAANKIHNSNRLDFESQIQISKKAKIKGKSHKNSVEKMMQKFYENASNILDLNDFVFESFKEKQSFSIRRSSKDFYYFGNKIGIKTEELLGKESLFFDIFLEIGRIKKISKIDTLTWMKLRMNINLIDNKFRSSDALSKKFLEILRVRYNLSYILKTMKDIGILQKYIPAFGKVVGQMQFDLFHIYTVDEHTFKLVRNIRQMLLIENDEFKLEHELLNKLPKIEILYLAGIFHDLGKGKGGDHSEIGSKISKEFSKKIGLSKNDSDLIQWLVSNHLLMSSISQKKDISDSNTISDFSSKVKSIERLDYLYLLTVNDIRATNPSLWNGWKHGLLRDLFLLTRSTLNKEPIKASSEIVKDRKKNLMLEFSDEDSEHLKELFSMFGGSYFTKNNLKRLKWHFNFLLKNQNNEIIECQKVFNNFIEVFVKVNNFDGLFLKLVRVFEQSGLNIVDANISTSKDKKIAINSFITKIKHHERPPSKIEINELKAKITKNYKNTKFNYKYSENKNNKKFSNSIMITNAIDHSKNRNLLTIEAADSFGLLVKIAKVLHKNGVSIHSARINTLGDRIEDTFEIEDITMSLVNDIKIKKITSQLKEVI